MGPEESKVAATHTYGVDQSQDTARMLQSIVLCQSGHIEEFSSELSDTKQVQIIKP